MHNKNIKKDNIFKLYGYNNCLPLLKKNQYEIIRINILDQKKEFFANIIDFQKYSHSLRFLNKNDFYNKHDGIRSQGIVVQFKGPIVKGIGDMPKAANISSDPVSPDGTQTLLDCTSSTANTLSFDIA